MQQREAGWLSSRVDPLACGTTASGQRLNVALPLCHQKPSWPTTLSAGVWSQASLTEAKR
jgi:hypothetical protein